MPIISPEYAALNRRLHEERDDFGNQHSEDAPGVLKFAAKVGAQTILDFGCGKGVLKPALLDLAPHLTVYEFDPAIPGKDVLPTDPVDVIAAMDVMEHIEEEYLEDALETLQTLARKLVIMKIALTPALKYLPDGRNAHILLKPAAWWRERLARRFTERNYKEDAMYCIYIGIPKPVA